MIHGRSPLIYRSVSAGRQVEASFSQGDTWKTLIRTYIAVMPSIGGMLEPEEQSAIGGASFAATHAMNARVGEAARASQPAAPRAGQAPALPLFAAEDVVIFQLPIDCRHSRPLQARGGM
jgi:hypothetical protein